MAAREMPLGVDPSKQPWHNSPKRDRRLVAAYGRPHDEPRATPPPQQRDSAPRGPTRSRARRTRTSTCARPTEGAWGRRGRASSTTAAATASGARRRAAEDDGRLRGRTPARPRCAGAATSTATACPRGPPSRRGRARGGRATAPARGGAQGAQERARAAQGEVHGPGDRRAPQGALLADPGVRGVQTRIRRRPTSNTHKQGAVYQT